MIGFSFSIVTCWTALAGTFIVGIDAGGPPVMIYSWIIISLGAMLVGMSFAEMCSAYPIAGGQYSWVAALAPAKWTRGMSWVTGWFMLVGVIGIGAANNFISANFVLGMAVLANDGYEIERWHVVLCSYCIILVTGLVNVIIPRALDRLGKAMFVWNLASFVIIIVTLLATTKNKADPEFVFTILRNDTGLSDGLGVMAGLLQSFFGMCCYDAAAHMTEEIKDARRNAPRAIISSVVLGGLTGLIFLIVTFFCIDDISAVANTATGVPFLAILYSSTGSVPGTCILTSLVTVICLISANSLMAEGSRSVWAFARDRGLPGSVYLSRVEERFGVPVLAIVVCGVCQGALNTIYLGTTTGFNTVTSIATEGFYISYFMPLFARVLSHMGGEPVSLGGTYTLGKYGVPINAAGAAFLFIGVIIFNFPSEGPIVPENMNYCSAAVGIVALASLITWVHDGKRNFSLGNIRGEINGIETSSESNDKSHISPKEEN